MTIYRNFKKKFQDYSPKYFNILDRYKLVVKYLISGGLAAFVDLALLFIFTDIVGLYYLISATLAFMVAFFVSFFLQKFWTFRDTGSDKRMYRQMFFYFLIGVGNLGANAGGMYLLVSRFETMYIIAQIIMGALLAVVSFTINRLFIFKKRKKMKKLEGSGKKRILIATGIFPPAIGGPATYSKTLLEELPLRGFEVKIVTYGQGEVDKDVFFVSMDQNLFSRYFKYFWRVWKLRNWAQLVYVQGPVSEGLPAFLACKLAGKKYLLKIVGDYAWESFNRKRKIESEGAGFIDMLGFQDAKYDFKTELLRKIEKIVARRAEIIITPSEYLKEVVKRWGIDGGKIKVIYNSVKKAEIRISKEEAKRELDLSGDIIFSSARLVPWKGMKTLIELMPELLEANPNFKLVINGDGPDFAKLSARAGKVSDRIIFTGAIEQRKVWHYMRSADMFVLNTGYEGLPHIVIEAMQIGTPVITTKVGGNTEVVENDKNGILVEYDNKDEIKKAILDLWADEPARKRLATEAKNGLDKFGRERMIDNIISLIDLRIS